MTVRNENGKIYPFSPVIAAVSGASPEEERYSPEKV
jgi:hypothetical protein